MLNQKSPYFEWIYVQSWKCIFCEKKLITGWRKSRSSGNQDISCHIITDFTNKSWQHIFSMMSEIFCRLNKRSITLSAVARSKSSKIISNILASSIFQNKHSYCCSDKWGSWDNSPPPPKKNRRRCSQVLSWLWNRNVLPISWSSIKCCLCNLVTNVWECKSWCV